MGSSRDGGGVRAVNRGGVLSTGVGEGEGGVSVCTGTWASRFSERAQVSHVGSAHR